MKIFITLIVFLAFSGTAFSQAVDSTKYTCADLRTLIKEEGSVVLAGPRRTRVYGNPLGCPILNIFGHDQRGVPEICPTIDKKFCNVGVKCVAVNND